MENDWDSANSSFLAMNDTNQSQKFLNIIESKDNIKYKNPKTTVFVNNSWCWVLLYRI